MTTKELLILIQKEETKAAKCRDRLRELSDEASELAEDLDMACDELSDAVRLIEYDLLHV